MLRPWHRGDILRNAAFIPRRHSTGINLAKGEVNDYFWKCIWINLFRFSEKTLSGTPSDEAGLAGVVAHHCVPAHCATTTAH
jgi:hypothetical protein